MFIKYCHFLILCLLGLTIAAKVAEKTSGKDVENDGSLSPVILKEDTNNSTTNKPTTTTTPAPDPTTPTTTPKTTPSTTQPPAPSTTLAPPITTKAPDVKPDKWIVSDNTTNCILAKMTIKFSVSYNTSQNKIKTVDFNVPSNATAGGNCGNSSEALKLPFDNSTGIITFNFTYNSTAKEYYTSLIGIELEVNNKTFPNNSWVNTTKIHFTLEGEFFKNSVNRSYTCASPDSLKLNNTILNVTNSLTLSNIQLEAFGTHKDNNFSAGIDCVTSETPDIVPIVVGTTLAILVIVVLIGFLVSRRRSQSRGYLSM